MSTVTSHAPSYTSSSHKGDALDLEPDKAWKEALRAKIEGGLSSMVADAKKNMQDQLDKEPVSVPRREELTHEYHEAMKTIRALAEETFRNELERERQERRWASGEAMLPHWNLALKQEQQDIMDRIKGSQKESSSPKTAEPLEGSQAPEVKPAEVRPKGPVPVELPPDLALKLERQQREEQERRERERKARERQEWERQERLDKERKDKELREEARKEQERGEREKEERERQERARQGRERQEKEKQERERQERERQGRERQEKERQERDRQAKERQEKEERDDREREWLRQQDEEREGGQEREQTLHSLRNTPNRRGSVTRNHMNSREDYQHPPLVYRRPSHPALAERYAPTDASDSDGPSDIDEETLLRPPNHHNPTRKASLHERPTDALLGRSTETQSRLSSERYVPRSPPNPIPQIWKPSSPEEDIASTRPPSTGLARRNSTTSIRSTGSAGHRPTIAEPIPERSDSEAEHGEVGRPRAVEPDPNWSSASSKPREKEKRREHRKSSASDQSRFEDPPSAFRAPYRPEDIQPLPPHGHRDRYDDLHSGYGSPRPPHRPDEMGTRPSPAARSPINHKPSFNADEWEHSYQSGSPRSVKPRGSFDDRAYPYSQPPTPAGRVVSRPPSIPSEERERFYDQSSYRSYPTPPSSASRSTGRDYTSQQGWYGGRGEPPTSYAYGEPRSNTYKYAQQSDSPKRRSSESRQTLAREPSFTKNFSEEPYQVHASPSDSYPRTYDGPPSASIPINRHRPSPAAEESEGWKSWVNEVPPPPPPPPPPRRRDSRRDSDRRGGYSQHEREDGPLLRDQEYNGRYELWEREQRDDDDQYWHQYGPVGPPPDWGRRDISRQVRSPASSYPGSYHETTSFGGREAQQVSDDDSEYELEEDEDALYEVLEQDKLRRVERPYEVRRMEGGPRVDDRPYRAKNMARDPGSSVPTTAREDSEINGDPGIEHRPLSAKRMEEEDAKEKARKLEEEAKKKAEEAKQLEEEARRKAEEAKMLEEEARKKAEEAREFQEAKAKAEEEAKKLKEKQEEIRQKELETKKKAAEVRRKEEEAKKKEAEARKKEAEAKKKEAEAKRKEQEAKKKEEEAGQKEREARRREEEAHTKEEETRKKEEEIRQREEDLRKREEELTRREQEIASQKEAERLQKEWDLEEEERRLSDERRQAELERFRKEQQQQEEFRRREQEIRQKAEERKRQDSVGAESSWSPSSYSSTSSSRSHPQASTGTDRNGQAPGWTNNGGSAWASSTKSGATANPSTSTASSTSKPRSGSINSAFPTTPSPHPPSAKEESEWKRRQEEQFQKQQERFREEQQRLENARQRAQSSVLSKEEVVALYEFHDRQWALLSSSSDLRWESVPWPMFKSPKSPEDITVAAVSAYMQSPHYPEKDKSKTHKDRLKDHIKKWHPDRFETKYLPRFVEDDRERVKEGAGSVARTLSDLLMRSNVPNPFS